MSKADLSKQPAQVAAMFDQVSTRYDRTNNVLSVGNAALWRVATTRAVAPRAGETILDVAAGTGTSSASLARNGASVVAADFSAGMIDVGRQRQAGNPFIRFVQADAMDLPFDDDTFDAVTISFGLRNIVDPKKALAEFFRVVKPGGRVVVCEFSQPPLAPVRAGYSAYLKFGMPVLARVASSNPAAYEYLMESIQAWPDQRALAGWMREAGFERVAYRNLTAGIVALHRGFKPERRPAPVEPVEPVAATPDVNAQPEAPAEKPAAATKPKAAPKPKAAATKAKPAAAKPAAAKPAAAKSAAPKSAAARPTTPKPAAPKPKRSTSAGSESRPASAGTAGSEESASTIPSEGE
ncbi:demethylmenaquinone methyltransferase / 2-methoxy-6-polyprenyl-1,4-benzoquinol methylase [Leifsonia sp. 98AMF]|uniref:bifunctional demethylmenaquinone methyltransferase/2-methoxy-6-polyprenyl-1,4-benzoquinol methylase UbiE n=1 Tax=unclassified Leifsonia TaxID=2663824 RepID=UPI00087B46AD|nr:MULTISPECIES: bifunctional demethylmenaquinone methyltransferase/2-methoxy-6-polyprenyl-1,4-benzoquinol methylase UbiE [unclassified Leifsonia]SDH06224.1 demethylmenaquinone methyltransferase / 2-methoxy-6-polyprenyl-1,4-benzoquinol methylase [Leifsonia sp. 197AMF]SDJ34154.1 demethylmenaquinone methyltransferase / 2-methoxy-6-polyprenyl-1,4-benzoquinol methylase [Leifsonia sp. 466MF]SDK45745.1 demethylmenaquinone methyltransferase / 2-methoxy-6-polyprenyl-1,4-benzoquinol methylase [Leifsonia 